MSTTNMAADKYSVEIAWGSESGMWIAICPELEGISGFGFTRAEAADEIGVAIKLALETYTAEGWEIPEPNVWEQE